MSPFTPHITEALSHDPLAALEAIVGKRWQHFTPDEEGLSLALSIQHSRDKNALLQLADDSFYGITWAAFIDLARRLGFVDALAEDNGKEFFAIMWHPSGVLFCGESYNRKSVNTAKIYFNWRGEYSDITGCSCSWSDGVMIGDKDVREGFRHFMDSLNAGELVTPWVKRPFMWFIRYTDSEVEGYDHKAITEERISRLPEHIRKSITP